MLSKKDRPRVGNTAEAPRRIRRVRRIVRALPAVGIALVLAGGWSLVLAVTHAGAATLGGTATITNPLTSQPLTSGGSATVFTVTLPQGAACSGDTATGGYHVYSFMVHPDVDITTVTFVNFPSTGYGYVDGTGTYYGPANTAITTGQIVSIPNSFEWAPLVTTGGGSVALSELLYGGTAGTWETGLVCANTNGVVTDDWSTDVTFTAASADPAGFTWTVASGSSATTTTAGGSGSSTTTTASGGGSTTTTTVGATTTTTAEQDTSTTTSTLVAGTSDSSTTTIASQVLGTSTNATPSASSGASGSVGTVSGVDGSLAVTGIPAGRFVAVGLACIGTGLLLLGLWARLQQGGPIRTVAA